MSYFDDSPHRMCEACEAGEHWNCGMQTWCECECDGPHGTYDAPLGPQDEMPAPSENPVDG